VLQNDKERMETMLEFEHRVTRARTLFEELIPGETRLKATHPSVDVPDARARSHEAVPEVQIALDKSHAPLQTPSLLQTLTLTQQVEILPEFTLNPGRKEEWLGTGADRHERKEFQTVY